MTKKAFLVGINDYAPSGHGGPDLRGCVNDVRDMAHTLNVLGIVPAIPRCMRIITNSGATRANILNGLKWIVTGAKKGDTLVFYYSGHGSYVADTSGDEIDHRDEAICPHDYATAGMIIDDVFRSCFSGVPTGVNLEVILDSCFSGTATRTLLNAPVEEKTIRYVEPPIDYGLFVDEDPQIPTKGFLKAKSGEKQVVIVPGLNHVLWSGCKDNQTAGEGLVDGVIRGYFTSCFCKILRRTSGHITRMRLDAGIATCVKGQTPQLECTKASLTEEVFK